jgi:hypothetical protein
MWERRPSIIEIAPSPGFESPQAVGAEAPQVLMRNAAAVVST